jgi:hypothetical protein
MQLSMSLLHALFVSGIHHEDDGIRFFIVVQKEFSDFIGTSHIPTDQLHFLKLNSFNIEADGGNGEDYLSDVELVEKRGFTSIVDAHHNCLEGFTIEQLLEWSVAAKVCSHRNQS